MAIITLLKYITILNYRIQTLSHLSYRPSALFHLLTAEEDAFSKPDGFMFPVTFILFAAAL